MPTEERKTPEKERAAAHIKRARIAAGYETQGDAAQAAGMELGQYGQYERGYVMPPGEALLALRRIFRQTADYLLGLDDPCDISPEGRLLLELFESTRNPGLRDSILNHAKIQHDLDRSLPMPADRPPPRAKAGPRRNR